MDSIEQQIDEGLRDPKFEVWNATSVAHLLEIMHGEVFGKPCQEITDTTKKKAALLFLKYQMFLALNGVNEPLFNRYKAFKEMGEVPPPEPTGSENDEYVERMGLTILLSFEKAIEVFSESVEIKQEKNES